MVVKHQYFSALIVSLDSHPGVLFQVTHTLKGRGDSQNPLRGHVEKIVHCLLDKVTEIYSQLDIGCRSQRDDWGRVLPDYLGIFEPVGPAAVGSLHL